MARRSSPTMEAPSGGQGNPRMVFLHIGKTGGTALKHMFGLQGAKGWAGGCYFFRHDAGLSQVAEAFPEAEIGFVVRDPLDRIVSGFLSRQRQGRPRYFSAWTEEERAVFDRFPTFGALATGIAAQDPAALAAFDAVRHLRLGYAHYLESCAALDRHAHRIGFVGLQSLLARDVEWLKVRIGMDPRAALPDDDILAHRNPVTADRAIPSAAEPALRALLATDYALYAWSLNRRKELGIG